MSPLTDQANETRDLAAVAEAVGSTSDLLAAARAVAKRPENVLGLLVRELTKNEIAIMEDRGCRSDDWSLVQVAADFDPFRVRRTHFQGQCVLGRFSNTVVVADGLSLPSGIYDCTLVNCQIGNDALLEKVRFAAGVVVEREAVLFDVGSVTSTGQSRFGCGQELSIAIETGGREVPLWAEITVPDADVIARERGDHAGQQVVREAVAAYAEEVTMPVVWVRRGAAIRHTDRLVDIYLGPSGIIDNAQLVTDAAVLSADDEPTVIAGGATVEHAVLQWGASVGGNGIVRHSLIGEHASVDQHGVVEQSIIGPNTTIAKGEVTSSLVGPFVGFHHQSLLIAALWPEGKGNVAYGAMVGSNHTGRAPDQEIWPGEGTFFGLGSSVRFPADYSQSPYSVISSGVATLPQKLEFPFSLIATPVEAVDVHQVPRAFNEVLPGWGLYANAYGIERSELKFAKRDKSRRHRMHYHILRPSIMRLVRQGLERLESVSEDKELYLETDIPGLGKNFLRPAARQQAIESYRRVLLRYALRILLGEAEDNVTIPGSLEVARELVTELLPGSDLTEQLTSLIDVERKNAEIVEASKAADDERGVRIIPGYADAHTAAAEDPVVQHAWERVASTERRVAAVLGKKASA